MRKLLISGILGILMLAMPVFGQMTSQDVINQITNAERKLTEAQFKEFIRNFENQKHKVHWRGKVTDVKEVMILGNFTDQRTVWVADFVFFNMDKSIALTLNKGQEIDFTGTISSFLRIPFLVSLSIGLSDVQLVQVLQDKPITKERRKERRFVENEKDEKWIYDNSTELEWYVGPDRNTSWNDAKSWTENLTVGGGDWRMPTMAELKGIYQEGAGRTNMDPVFQTTGSCVWSSETGRGESMRTWFVFFVDKGYSGPADYAKAGGFRAFAVRKTLEPGDPD